MKSTEVKGSNGSILVLIVVVFTVFHGGAAFFLKLEYRLNSWPKNFAPIVASIANLVRTSDIQSGSRTGMSDAGHLDDGPPERMTFDVYWVNTTGHRISWIAGFGGFFNFSHSITDKRFPR